MAQRLMSNGKGPCIVIFLLLLLGLSNVYGRNGHPNFDAPVFSAPSYSFSVLDNLIPGGIVGSVAATDIDNDPIKYSIVSGNTNQAFSIDSLTGLIKLSKTLNYHSQANYNIIVKASDPGGLSTTASLAISVSPGNAIAPFDIVSWGTAASQPYTVSELQGLVVKGKLYTFGGFDSQKSGFTPTSRAYVYDPVSNTWTAIAPMPPMNGTAYGGVTHAGFATDGTDIYFAGGYTSSSGGTSQIFGTKEVWKYVVADNRYERLPNLPVTISCGRLEYVAGKLYHIGGTNSSRTTDVDFTYALDLDNQPAGWKKLASLPNPRQHAGSAVFEGKIYYIGGQRGHDDTLVTKKDVHQYDPVTNTWTQVADLPVPTGANGRSHIAAATTVIGNQIVVVGGEIKHEVSINMVSSYNPATNSWTNLTPLPANRSSGVVANLGGKLFYSGGSGSKTTYKGLPNVQQLISFTLINADTDQPIQTLKSGATLNLGTLPTRNLAINAITNFSSGSVKFSLTGSEVKTVNDNTMPYSLTGDSGADYLPWTPTVGSYTLKGTPYSGPDGTGTPSTAVSIKFTVVDQPQQVVSYSLINSDNEQPIVTFSADTTLNLADLPTRNLNIRANTNSTAVGSIKFNISGVENRGLTDNAIPFSVFEDNRGDYYDWTPTVGSYTLNATPFTAANASGTIGLPLKVQLSIIDQPIQQIAGFDIINADSDQPIKPLISGSTINLTSLPTRNLNIRANTIPGTVDSVVFSLAGVDNKTVKETAAPYALFGEINGDFAAWNPKVGHYVLKATPYITVNGAAVSGPSSSIVFAINDISLLKDTIISPLADAYVRDGSSYANINYGFDSAAVVNGATSSGNTRQFYLRFPLNNVGDVVSAKLRIFGRNTASTTGIVTPVYGVDDDNWTETGITWNNAPKQITATALGVFTVNNQRKYYEVDVSDFVKGQFDKDKNVSFLIKDTANKNKLLSFNSRENIFSQPQLLITTSATPPASNALLFVENLDKFPSNNDFAASHVQNPWSRDQITFNMNHDTLRIRVHNKGINPLIVSNLTLSNKKDWKIISVKGSVYNPSMALPLIISSGTFADVQVKFIPTDSAVRVRLLSDQLTIVSNDDKQPIKTLYLRGLFQRDGEGSKEPRAQEIIATFGFKTKTGISSTDPDKGANNKPKGDEILAAYFIRVDATKPVTARQLGAYHGCCDIQPEYLKWYPKGNTSLLSTVVAHVEDDAQSLLPRRNHNLTYAASEGSFNPSTAFGFKIGTQDWSDTLLNTGRKIGIRVWKAIDARGLVIPNAYIISNDYLGTSVTNYDYNDNMYYITNVRPEVGAAVASALGSTPSSIDFGEQVLQSKSDFVLSVQNLGQTNNTPDPAINISAVAVVGQNASEFITAMPQKTTLAAGETTSLTVSFSPSGEGLKVADLLIYYNNAGSPLRVPLYGIGKAATTTVTVPYRIKSGSASEVTVGGKTFVGDTPYAFDNLEPFTNASLSQISCSEEDALYLREQSSNADKRPFRYEMPLANGTYWVRLHFAEIYWGAPGSGLSGGAGSRVMSVALEGEPRLINLDVAGEVGAGAALVKVLPVTVSDGKLNINFSATVNRPMVCAIEVFQFNGGSPLGTQRLRQDVQLAQDNSMQPKAYPNPLHQRFVLEMPSSLSGNVSLQLVDASGRSYDLGKTFVPATGNKLGIDLTNRNLAPGIYFLNIRTEAGKINVIKLLIQ